MTFRKLLASVVAMCLTVPALAQVPTLVNGNLETLDPYFSDIQIFNPIIRVPQGMRLYNLTRYRWINDPGSPATVTHSGVYSVLLPGSADANGIYQSQGELAAVHSEEKLDQGNPLTPRDWPQYAFNPPNGQPITVSCWFNIPASDPVTWSRFGLKLGLIRNGGDLSYFQEFEWLDVDPNAPPLPNTFIVDVIRNGTHWNAVHTNGKWLKFQRTLPQALICQDFGSTCMAPPTNPARATLLALRFDVGLCGQGQMPPCPSPPTFGKIWVDDLRFRQGAPCNADFNESGTVTVQDIFDFLTAYFAVQPSADFNNTGTLTVQDIFDFLTAYFAGCP